MSQNTTSKTPPAGLDFDPIREFITAVWSDCRLPGTLRRDLEALYHNGVMPALNAEARP